MTDRRSFFSRLLSSKPTSSPPRPITNGRRAPTTTAPPPTTATSAPTPTKPPPATTAPPLPSATTTFDPNTGPAPPATTTTSPPTTTQLATTSSTTSTPPPPPATTEEPPPANPTTPPATTTTTTEPPPSKPTTSPPPPSPSSPTTPPPSTITATAIESQTVGHSTASTTPDSPYNSATSSPSPSPSRITTKSSPLESPSPSHAISPHTRSKPSSPSRVSPPTPSTPQRVPQPRSPSRTPKQISPSSKMKQHASPSKESTQEITASKSHQETKPDSSTMNGTNNPLFESNEKNEGPGDVKEIVEATNGKANGETMTEAQSSAEAKIMEKGEVPSVKPTNTTNSHPKKRNTNSNIHNKKFTLPIRERAPLHKDIKEDISTFLNRISIADPTKAAQDRAVSVITLVGENRGASMQMGSNSSKTEGPIPIHRSYNMNSEENVGARTTTDDGEGSSEGKERMDAEDQPKEAHVNNNAQGINNSIVFNGSITEGSPGVHMVVNHVPMQSTESTQNPSQIDARKAEFNSTRMEKLTYEPTVRRRCLRGLFLEPSDSDKENPEKPRRHGCRVGCQQSNKGNNVDVL